MTVEHPRGNFSAPLLPLIFVVTTVCSFYLQQLYAGPCLMAVVVKEWVVL